MIRKYVPRAYSNLKGMAGLNLTPTIVLSTGMLSPYYSPEAQDTFQKLARIGPEVKGQLPPLQNTTTFWQIWGFHQ